MLKVVKEASFRNQTILGTQHSILEKENREDGCLKAGSVIVFHINNSNSNLVVISSTIYLNTFMQIKEGRMYLILNIIDHRLIYNYNNSIIIQHISSTLNIFNFLLLLLFFSFLCFYFLSLFLYIFWFTNVPPNPFTSQPQQISWNSPVYVPMLY